MPTGCVKWFKSEKGYGFIINDADQKDIFVHYLEIMRSDRQLKSGEKVEFETAFNTKGTFAKNVKVL
jgi:CspA family cold shock protein